MDLIFDVSLLSLWNLRMNFQKSRLKEHSHWPYSGHDLQNTSSTFAGIAWLIISMTDSETNVCRRRRAGPVASSPRVHAAINSR